MQVLDLGSVDLMLVHGDDMLVVNAARVSFGNEDWFNKVAAEGEEKLISFLVKHRHVSPFYHPVLTFRVKCPISVHRQWEKHKIGTASNSQSTRYSVMPDEVYVPEFYRAQSKSNKQGSMGCLEGRAWKKQAFKGFVYSQEAPQPHSLGWEECDIQELLADLDARLRHHSRFVYEEKLRLGVAKEQARGMLPLDLYSSFVWTASLQAFWHFLQLRESTEAQWEIQEYARAMQKIVTDSEDFKLCFKAFHEYASAK